MAKQLVESMFSNDNAVRFGSFVLEGNTVTYEVITNEDGSEFIRETIVSSDGSETVIEILSELVIMVKTSMVKYLLALTILLSGCASLTSFLVNKIVNSNMGWPIYSWLVNYARQ